LTGSYGVLQRRPWPEVLPGRSFDDEPEERPESGHTFAFELAKPVDETAQSSGLRCAELDHLSESASI
jgi:hypothetical protein